VLSKTVGIGVSSREVGMSYWHWNMMTTLVLIAGCDMGEVASAFDNSIEQLFCNLIELLDLVL